MLDQAAINRLNQHPTSKEAEAEMKRLEPDWYLSEFPNVPVLGMAIVDLLATLWENEGEHLERPEAKEKAWLEDQLQEMSEAELKEFLDRTEIKRDVTLQDQTGAFMLTLEEMNSEKPEDEQIVIPDFWP